MVIMFSYLVILAPAREHIEGAMLRYGLVENPTHYILSSDYVELLQFPAVVAATSVSAGVTLSTC
jgi:hypothetical protein